MSSSEDEEAVNSEASSYDSEEFGAVARNGYTRMYILTYSSLSATDQSHDDDDDVNENDGYYGGHGSSSPALFTEPKYQLIYTNRRQVYHGTIELPEDILQRAPSSDDHRYRCQEEEDDEEKKLEQKEQDLFFDSTQLNTTVDIGLCDIPSLIPFFQEQKQKLERLKEDVLDLRPALRDVFYQMEEVAEFMCEEISKDKNIDRIEQASKEFHWICDEKNPTFFELQTYKQTNDSLKEANVQFIVMKIIVRDVLLDILYHQDSYYVSLRENTSELEFEETFIPNMSCMGPCFLVRRYNDADLYKLILWCSVPALSIEGLALPLKQHITKNVQPLKSNNTQLFCIFQQTNISTKTKTKTKKSQKNFQTVDQIDIDPFEFDLDLDKKESKEEEEEEESNDFTDHEVFLQFNAYCYFGVFPICTKELDNISKLTTKWIPHLRSQVDHLHFQCHINDLNTIDTSTSTSTTTTTTSSRRTNSTNFHSIVDLFHTFFVPKLVDLIVSSEKWIENFMNELDITSNWVGSHIKKWLENENGVEFFFELELDKKIKAFEQVELLLWKGIVHHAWLMVIYRRGSFYIVLRDAIAEENDTNNTSMMLLDAFFPTIGSKGRGYLIQQFTTSNQSKDSWLHKARLTLWQTTESIEQEMEVTAKTFAASSGNKKTTSHSSDWFEEDENINTTTTNLTMKKKDNKESESEMDSESEGDLVIKFCHKKKKEEEKQIKKGKTSVQSHHHLAPMKHKRPLVQAPWDVKTGKPLFVMGEEKEKE